ncbi:MAG: PAS domain-containing protein [Blastocatellia bacterium]
MIVESRHQLNESGGRRLALVTNRDITVRKQMEDRLRESEERARALVEQMITGVAECGATGKFALVNQRFCDIVGYTQAELLEMRIGDITHPDDWPHTAELYRRLFEK